MPLPHISPKLMESGFPLPPQPKTTDIVSHTRKMKAYPGIVVIDFLLSSSVHLG